jgi:L-ribulose-5-phosphate 3-epimerase UlaE
MAKSFSKKFKKLSSVLSELQIQHQTQVPFVVKEKMKATAVFTEDLEFVFHRVPYNTSEFAICENLIYPTLKEVWKQYADIFNMWSRALIQLNLNIKGYPDYLPNVPPSVALSLMCLTWQL